MPSVKTAAPAEVHPSVLKAENAAKLQRFAGLALLRVDESKATPAELAIFGKIKNAANADVLDKMLAAEVVCGMFCRRVLFYGGTEP